jgi:hypothetical protein
MAKNSPCEQKVCTGQQVYSHLSTEGGVVAAAPSVPAAAEVPAVVLVAAAAVVVLVVGASAAESAVVAVEPGRRGISTDCGLGCHS